MTLLKTQNDEDSTKISGCQRLRGREMNWWSTEDVWAVKLFCTILQLWTLAICLSKPMDCTTPRVNYNV